MENGQSPGRRRAEAALWRAAKAGGATEKMGLDRCVLSFLTGLVLCSRHYPAINRWAIFERPCGTWNRDTQNTYKAQKTTLTQWLRDCYIGPVTSVCRSTCQPAARIATVFVGDGVERDASTRRTPCATFLSRHCHRWWRGPPQTPVRTPPTSSAAARQLSRSKMIALVIGLWCWISKNLAHNGNSKGRSKATEGA